MFFALSAMADTNATFVDQSLTQAQQLLAIKDQSDRNLQLCSLLGDRIGSDHIAKFWLGTFETLSRDQAAVNQFHKMVPSIMMTTILPLLGSGGAGTQIIVDPNSSARGGGVFEVAVTFRANGRDYPGKAVVMETGGVLKIIDAEYRGMSAVDYQGREYKKFLEREFNKDPNSSMPVSALVQSIAEQEDYIGCP
jgi:hypothetical protein